MIFLKKKPLLLYSYLATEMLAPFFATFFIMNGIFFIVKLIPFLDLVLSYEIGLADFIRASFYLFPKMMSYSIPMAAMMGVIFAFTRLSNDLEILALKTCGLSIYSLVPPVIIVSVVISVITAYFSIAVRPASEGAIKQLFFQLTKEKIDKGIKERKFTATLGDLVVYVEDIDRETNNWNKVWVSDMRGGDVPIITMASSGKMSTDLQSMMVTIVLYDGSMHRAGNTRSQTVTFKNYKVEIPIRLPANKYIMKGNSALTMSELLEKARSFPPDSKERRRVLAKYYDRIILPFGCLVISLLALPLGLQAGPGRPAYGIPLGLASFIFYYVFYTMGKTVAEDSSLPVWLAMWTPNVIFGVLAVIGIVRVAAEKPLMPEIINTQLIACRQFLGGLRPIRVLRKKR